jgi:hypothetical protein
MGMYLNLNLKNERLTGATEWLAPIPTMASRQETEAICV